MSAHNATDKVAQLAERAAVAAQVRTLTTGPDVIALHVERVRAQVDALLWVGIVLALAFTMVNVQSFAASGSGRFSLAWWVAWLVDPMVSLVLLAVLRAEQVTARYQVALPAWARRTKWLTFAATYVMNTWTSWGLDGARPLSWSGVVLHSVPPLVVFATAETGPGLRDRLTEAVHRAVTEHTVHAASGPTGGPVVPIHESRPEPVRERAPHPRPPARRDRSRKGRPTSRRLLADYIADARAALDAASAGATSVEVTPAWCREVTGCSAGTSVKVAAALRLPDQVSTAATTSDDRSKGGRPR